MNSLSWLIYVAEVFDRLNPVFGIPAVLIGLGSLIYMAVQAGSESDGAVRPGTWKKGFKGFAFVAPLVILLVLIPSKETIYMIAASEAGEQVIKTPEAREMFEALRLRIMEELKVEVK